MQTYQKYYEPESTHGSAHRKIIMALQACEYTDLTFLAQLTGLAHAPLLQHLHHLQEEGLIRLVQAADKLLFAVSEQTASRRPQTLSDDGPALDLAIHLDLHIHITARPSWHRRTRSAEYLAPVRSPEIWKSSADYDQSF